MAHLTIHIGSDHAGRSLKEDLKTFLHEASERGLLPDGELTIDDHGTDSDTSCDYPLFAHAVCRDVGRENSTGILICGTGLGMSMAANRHRDIRAALCTTELHARLARRHNNANVLCLGARVTGVELAKAITLAFLQTPFEGGRHAKRLALLSPDAEG
ncbi:MAG: ribose 5-phosphate isomerase B [Desulfovibrio sp.]|nr:ribose 5-phosphate isomerase B [Desulfovibrio sp.]